MLHLLLRIFTGGTLLFYGVRKLWGDPVDFLKSIKAYEILPTEPPLLLNLSAVGLPWLELVCGIAILSGVMLRGASLLSCAVLTVFTVAIGYRAVQVMTEEGTAFMQIAFDCGCGSGEVVIWQKLLINSALILATAWLVRKRAAPID